MTVDLRSCDVTNERWRSVSSGILYPWGGTTSLSYDWSSTNPPWAYVDPAQFTAAWPTGVNIVDIQTGSGDFYTNLNNTVTAAGARCVVRLGAGTYHLNQFRLIGSSGDVNYAFGYWHPNLQGLLGAGPDQTIVQMDASSMTTAQVTRLHDFTSASFQPSQIGFMRFDSLSTSTPTLIAGLTFRGADQNLLSAGAFASDVPAALPQPAPYGGITLYQPARAIISYVRFQACGHAATSSPPYEIAHVGSQYGSTSIYNSEFDGRLAPELNAAQPRRTGVIMGNNETLHELTDCWLHHSNVSRYAINDQNRNTSGTYNLTRCKLEHITDTHNVDPVYGALGGYTNASCIGYESCSGTINHTDCIVSVDNPFTDNGTSRHVQFTSVGSRNPQGGRLHIKGGSYRNTGFPSLDGYLTMWVDDPTFWWTDGIATTLDIRDSNNTPKTPFVASTAHWPPTSTELAAAGATPDTHYIVRTN